MLQADSVAILYVVVYDYQQRWIAFVWFGSTMYMLTKTCFILIARFTLGIKEFFQCDKISYYQFFANIFSDIFFPFFNVECVHLFVTNECVYLDDRTSYLEHYRDVIHVYFKFLCNETGCKVINMI